jgi:hypothetical protein
MDEVIAQAPPGISDEEILKVYNNNNQNKLDTLFELWNIVDMRQQKPITKFDSIREICDAHDIEMQKLLRGEIKLDNNNKNNVI